MTAQRQPSMRATTRPSRRSDGSLTGGPGRPGCPSWAVREGPFRSLAGAFQGASKMAEDGREQCSIEEEDEG